ncbi:hypothetical protein [Paludisphaera rhizosphaerae]|uniref:hypothetical protein n=1 Tax=Paludisphaera rhizosphaerae TaxID=2711216 RepID=UPI0013EDE071|nr:hypothetical protein [Paludisphaera rhizosphaerae]
MADVTLEQARAVKDRARILFAARTQVVGVGIQRVDGGFGLKINLQSPPPPDVDLPRSIDGVPIRVEVVGAIRKE